MGYGAASVNSWPDTQQSLIQRLADANDASAWHRFEQCYQSAIYRLARSRGLQADEALDVVQEVLLAVHRRAVHWTPSGRVGSFRAWLAETTRRQTFASLRFRNRVGDTLDLIQEPAAKSSVPSSECLVDEEQEWLFYESIAEVEKGANPTHWLVFWMTTIDGVDPATVAQRLGLKLGSVYSIKSRILATIKARIQEHSVHPRADLSSPNPAERESR